MSAEIEPLLEEPEILFEEEEVIPACSICLSTRNKSQYLANSLASIYRQTPPFQFEVIVVDDGSTDETEDVCAQYSGLRYFYLNNPRYRNPSVARNIGFRAARAEVILAQSDDIIHVAGDAIEYLTFNVEPTEVLLGRTHNYIYQNGEPTVFKMEYCGPNWQKPYFFLGAIHRKHICAIGGYDEEFVEPCFDDNWFADCLIKGLGLSIRYTEKILAHHQSHGYEEGSHDKEHVSREIYYAKVKQAKKTKKWIASGGAWPMKPREPAVQPEEKKIITTGLAPLVQVPIENPPVTKIPRRMSFFWVGDRLSWMRYLTLYSFRKYHRDWDVILYRMPAAIAGGKTWVSTEIQDSQVYQGIDYSQFLSAIDVEVKLWEPDLKYPRSLAPSHACDLCQWEILSTAGGWYADMDILWVSSLKPELVADANAIFCLTDAWMAIGLMAASPESPLFKAVLKSALENYNTERYQCTGAEAIYRMTGQWPHWGAIERVGVKSLNILKRRYDELRIIDLPQVTVYPWSYLKVDKIFSEDNEVPAGCKGIHWFGGSQLGQQWNLQITHQNWERFHSTFTRYVRQCAR